MTYESINPYTEECLATFPILSDTALDTLIADSEAAFAQWRYLPLNERLLVMRNIKSRLLTDKEKYARLITLEMGKLHAEAVAEVEKCALLCDMLINESTSATADILVLTDFQSSYITFEPMGIILGIMPWNYPFWQALRFALPTMVAGNTILLKHAPSVPQCALAIEALIKDCNNLDIYRNLFISNEQAARVLGMPAIKGVSLTGSTRAGSAVSSIAGSHVKKSVLELGGSDPFIVLNDADMDKAVETATRSRYMNAGQSCIAAKRFIIEEKVYDTFIQKLKERLSHLKMGDPEDSNTAIAPMARRDLVEHLHAQVLSSINEGAVLETGGFIPDLKGFFYPATILTHCAPEMTCCREEMFGPVASVIKAQNFEEAIQMANHTVFGLGAAIFTQDMEKAKAAVQRIEAGNVFVNAMTKSDPRLPFGGSKQSGYGRELGTQGLQEFVNLKTVCINL